MFGEEDVLPWKTMPPCLPGDSIFNFLGSSPLTIELLLSSEGASNLEDGENPATGGETGDSILIVFGG